MLIVCGLVLLTGVMYVIPALGKYLEKMGKFLGGFQTIIGVIAIIVALVEDVTSLDGIMLLIVGIVLALGIMPMIPAIGKHMEKAGKFFAAYQVPIGIIAIILAFV